MEEKNIEKIEKTYIIPQDSLYIYGIAILMMVWHHFFGFPERFGGDLRYIGGNIEYNCIWGILEDYVLQCTLLLVAME